MGDLADLERNWEIYARSDPMWAVLMDPEKIGNRWEAEPFFAAGVAEVTTVLDHLSAIGVEPDFTGRALDFGCGVGRLSQALGDRFASVTGVDISPTMVEKAERLNRHGDRCRYVVNNSSDLAVLGSGEFAFVYTSIVLQHMQPSLAAGYVSEFGRVLAPGGVVVFQVPDRVEPGNSPRERVGQLAYRVQRAVGLRTRARRALRRIGVVRRPPDLREAVAEMNCLPEAEVRGLLDRAGLRLVDIQLTNSTDLDFVGGLRYLEAEPTAGFVSKQYCAVKTA